MLVVLQSVKAKVVPWAIDAVGTGLMVTVCAVEESELQPAALVTVHLYQPLEVAVVEAVVAPLLQL